MGMTMATETAAVTEQVAACDLWRFARPALHTIRPGSGYGTGYGSWLFPGEGSGTGYGGSYGDGSGEGHGYINGDGYGYDHGNDNGDGFDANVDE